MNKAEMVARFFIVSLHVGFERWLEPLTAIPVRRVAGPFEPALVTKR
jgi:hypothetical protein